MDISLPYLPVQQQSPETASQSSTEGAVTEPTADAICEPMQTKTASSSSFVTATTSASSSVTATIQETAVSMATPQQLTCPAPQLHPQQQVAPPVYSRLAFAEYSSMGNI